MNRIQRLLGMREGNAVVRQYKNAKIKRNVLAGTAGMDFYIAAGNAVRQDASGTLIMGGLTCLMVKYTKAQDDIMKSLRPMRDEIVARAKQIYKK